VYACDVHFEHCYALDTTDEQGDLKRQCWREWLAGYTFGQANDRIEYARRRLVELSPDYVAPTDGGSPTEVARAGIAVAPAPTSAFAPPPTTSDGERSQVVSKEEHDGGSGLPAPAAACTRGCEDQWQVCRGSCTTGGCAPCDSAYRSCMPACFKDGAAAKTGARTKRP
jgi:hypothetical protein